MVRYRCMYDEASRPLDLLHRTSTSAEGIPSKPLCCDEPTHTGTSNIRVHATQLYVAAASRPAMQPKRVTKSLRASRSPKPAIHAPAHRLIPILPSTSQTTNLSASCACLEISLAMKWGPDAISPVSRTKAYLRFRCLGGVEEDPDSVPPRYGECTW